jgi:hypothetical protein
MPVIDVSPETKLKLDRLVWQDPYRECNTWDAMINLLATRELAALELAAARVEVLSAPKNYEEA